MSVGTPPGLEPPAPEKQVNAEGVSGIFGKGSERAGDQRAQRERNNKGCERRHARIIRGRCYCLIAMQKAG